MHIAALICGILGLLSLPLLAVVHSPAPLFLALMLFVIAIVTGALSRAQRVGKAGLILGAIGLVGTAAVFFLFLGRTQVTTMQPVSTPAVAVPAPALK